MDKEKFIELINLIQSLSEAKQKEIYLMIKGAIWAQEEIAKQTS